MGRKRTERRASPITASAIFLSLACSSCAATYDERVESPTFSRVKRIIERSGADSVEGVLAALPNRYLENYTLMFESRSLQRASFTAPRAIVYGEDATFVMTFEGEPTHDGTSTLETMEFDRTRERFVFREISFVKTNGPPRVEISEDDPPRCASCHGRPLHPLWDSYPHWTGAYGETEGIDALHAPREMNGYREFLRVKDTHARYRHLAINSPIFAERNYRGDRARSANARFGMLLSRLNASSVLHDLVADDSFPAHAYSFVETLVGSCNAHASGPRVELAQFRHFAETWTTITPSRWGLVFDSDVATALPRDAFATAFVDHAEARVAGIREVYEAAIANGDCSRIHARAR